VSPRSLIEAVPAPHTLALSFAGVPIRVRTNEPDIRERLSSYFHPFVIGDAATPLADVSLVQGPAPIDGEFVDVLRTGGRRPKEATREVPGGRLILKTVTGVLIGLWPGGAFAAGDIRANLNQGINLVNNCFAKVVLRRGHVLLHASAVSRNRRTVVLAGPPGAGKSTSALHLVEAGFHCLSNDRVLAKPMPDTVEALGYPKQPRVNPGTLLGHPRLSALLAPPDRAVLAALPAGELWDLERKCDVDLDRIYGDGTVELTGEMKALILLRWRRDGTGLGIRRLTVKEGIDALPLVYKSLGAFDLDREPAAPVTEKELERYRELFGRVALVEITGKVDFKALVGIVDDLLAR
jgi:HprK-related kinase B